MVLIESMACARPVISTLSGSMPEVIGDAGILVQPNDFMSLYHAMKELIEGKERRELLGEKALARAQKNYDSKKTAERMLRVFQKVLNGDKQEENSQDVYHKGLALT